MTNQGRATHYVQHGPFRIYVDSKCRVLSMIDTRTNTPHPTSAIGAVLDASKAKLNPC